MCDNLDVDRSRGYNRRARKLLHIAGGLGAFTLPYIPWWVALVGAGAGFTLAWWLKPTHAWWLRYISKPADRVRHVITGFRGYTMTVLLLVILWAVSEQVAPGIVRYAMLGWLALAWGDGLAGLVGPGPSVARTVPWNKHKTWWGLLGGCVGCTAATAVALAWPIAKQGVTPDVASVPFWVILVTVLIVGPLAALLESLDTPVDDNYIVGLGAPALALAVSVLVR